MKPKLLSKSWNQTWSVPIFCIILKWEYFLFVYFCSTILLCTTSHFLSSHFTTATHLYHCMYPQALHTYFSWSMLLSRIQIFSQLYCNYNTTWLIWPFPYDWMRKNMRTTLMCHLSEGLGLKSITIRTQVKWNMLLGRIVSDIGQKVCHYNDCNTKGMAEGKGNDEQGL